MKIDDITAVSVSFLALVQIAISLAFWMHGRRIEKRRLTIDLHRDYWSIENYLKIIAPGWKVQMQWNHLPVAVREIYRSTVLDGWKRLSDEDYFSAYCGDPQVSVDYGEWHFRTPSGGEFLTEHQALTLLLYKWSQLAVFHENGMLENALFEVLFKDAYSYKRAFFSELALEMRGRVDDSPTPPQFIGRIKYLDRVFGYR
ncbi:hypothetical protein [Corynebacterium pygosceleis]|uniref:hypothetical protein n=1 Tax=Corynebacterium pygosceleis TaxID=2800406 RepID=UPI0019062B9B|nr:hypothetical protein [Corynebacterium pygosceleis]MCK7675559.1 hypothetical protein [Corynebacterium pygosceleis]MCL0121047.1 hypothetical protein [Corynebacterium pygosceleis]